MKYYCCCLAAIVTLFVFPVSSFGFFQVKDLEVNFSIDQSNILKSGENPLIVKICVRNLGKRSVFIVIEEQPRISYDLSKREIGLGFERSYGKYNYEVPRVNFLAPDESLMIDKLVPMSRFGEFSEGKWFVDITIGFIAETDYDVIGITPSMRMQKKSGDEIKIRGAFDMVKFKWTKNSLSFLHF